MCVICNEGRGGGIVCIMTRGLQIFFFERITNEFDFFLGRGGREADVIKDKKDGGIGGSEDLNTAERI